MTSSMFKTVDIARLSLSGVKVAHCRLPPTDAHRLVIVSESGSVAMGYNGQRPAVLMLPNGRTVERVVPPGTINLTGVEPVYWLRTPRAAEVVEVTASATLRERITSELQIPAATDLAHLPGWRDPQVWAILDAFRAASRGQLHLSDLKGDDLTWRLYAHVLCTKFGGKLPRWRETALDGRRLRRVLEFVEAHAAEGLSLVRLADVAALSPFHFARAFKLATGWSPHRYVTAMRIELARRLLLRGRQTVESIAEQAGFVNINHFRRLFRQRLGLLPSQVGSRRVGSDRPRRTPK
jgi:AraC family transcriptional regulator